MSGATPTARVTMPSAVDSKASARVVFTAPVSAPSATWVTIAAIPSTRVSTAASARVSSALARRVSSTARQAATPATTNNSAKAAATPAATRVRRRARARARSFNAPKPTPRTPAIAFSGPSLQPSPSGRRSAAIGSGAVSSSAGGKQSGGAPRAMTA